MVGTLFAVLTCCLRRWMSIARERGLRSRARTGSPTSRPLFLFFPPPSSRVTPVHDVRAKHMGGVDGTGLVPPLGSFDFPGMRTAHTGSRSRSSSENLRLFGRYSCLDRCASGLLVFLTGRPGHGFAPRPSRCRRARTGPGNSARLCTGTYLITLPPASFQVGTAAQPWWPFRSWG